MFATQLKIAKPFRLSDDFFPESCKAPKCNINAAIQLAETIARLLTSTVASSLRVPQETQSWFLCAACMANFYTVQAISAKQKRIPVLMVVMVPIPCLVASGPFEDFL